MAVVKSSSTIVERLCRPQRIGVFGHRGVGKTTFLTMLYREAVGGRLPDLRLGASDATTANYLHDRILQLEQGETLPATLAETDLHFSLYHDGARQDLEVRDYQGEHVGVGSEEPIREYLKDCDAILICLDAEMLSNRPETLRGQQEVEQLVEDYLKLKPETGLHRPMTLIITKADLLPLDRVADEQAWLAQTVEARLGMTAHALREHAPNYGFYAVSSLGRPIVTPTDAIDPTAITSEATPVQVEEPDLAPVNLDQPLRWLANVLREQDEARMKKIWSDPSIKLSEIERCVKVFKDRYPDLPATKAHLRRLKEAKKLRRRRSVVLAALLILSLVLGAWVYDKQAYSKVRKLAEDENDPGLALRELKSYQKFHPTRHLLSISSKKDEGVLEKELQKKLTEHNRKEIEARLSDLAKTPDAATPEEIRELFAGYRKEHPGAILPSELLKLEIATNERIGQDDLDDLLRDEHKLPAPEKLYTFSGKDPWRESMEKLIVKANGYIKKHAGAEVEPVLRARSESYSKRIDEHDFEIAQRYSAKEPRSFQTRIERYQSYLDRHPKGQFSAQVNEAITEIQSAWDKHDFRVVRDHFQEHPEQLKPLVVLAEKYLLLHPKGKYIDSAKELLRWVARVKGEREYRVTLKRGDFDTKISRWYTKGPDLAVTIEVNGVRYGPSTIVANSYQPNWEYEIPRPVRWKMGDRVRLIVLDYDYWDVDVLDWTSPQNEPLSMKYLSGKVHVDGHSLYFTSDFWIPKMPELD